MHAKPSDEKPPDGPSDQLSRLLRRQLMASACLLAASSVVPTVLAQAKPERPRITLAVGGKAALTCLPLTIAEQLGYFRSEGLELDIIDMAGPSTAVQAVVAGTADVISCGYEHAISQQLRSHFLQAFVMQGRAPQLVMGVSNRTVPFYQSVNDLKGRRIGVPGPEPLNSLLPSLLLARAGIRAGEVSFVDLGSTANALAALRSGQIDAISHTDPVMTMLEQKGDVKVISDTRTLKGTQDVYGGPMPSASLLASAEFIRRFPNTCQALANAMVHALKWLQTAGPGDIIKTVPETYLLGDRALYLAAFSKGRESISLDGLMPDKGPDTVFKALASQDLALKEARIDLGKTFVNGFAQRAKERFRA